MKKQLVWSRKKKIIWGLFLVLAWSMVGLLLYKTNGGLSVEQLVNFRPENPFLAVLAMLGLYLLKSVDFIMHSGVLYAASGVMFPLPAAIALNILGALIMVTPGYFIGRALGAPVLEPLKKRYPRLAAFVSQPLGGELTLSLLLRSVGLSLHVGSLYLGAVQTHFGRYMLGSLLGLLPVLIPYTVMGTNAKNPASPYFLIAVGSEITVALLSLLAAFLISSRDKRKAEQTPVTQTP